MENMSGEVGDSSCEWMANGGGLIQGEEVGFAKPLMGREKEDLRFQGIPFNLLPPPTD